MSKEINKYEIETLLQTKRFVDLSKEEQMFVLKQMSRKEYVHRQNILQSSKQLFTDTNPVLNPKIKENLLAELNKEKQGGATKKTSIVRLLNYPLPAWQAVAGIAAMLLFFWWKPDVKTVIAPSPEVVHVYHTDTIYKEAKIATVPKKASTNKLKKQTKKINNKPRPKIKNPVAIVTKTNTSSIIKNTALETNFSITDTSFMQSPISSGRSLKDEADLMDLFVELN